MKWDHNQIAEFLGVTPAIEETSYAGTQFTFDFRVGDLSARLVVYPRHYDVWVRLFTKGSDEELAEWRLECDHIIFNDEELFPEIDQDASCLAFQARLPDDIAMGPKHPLHWLLISRCESGFRVASYFIREHDSINAT